MHRRLLLPAFAAALALVTAACSDDEAPDTSGTIRSEAVTTTADAPGTSALGEPGGEVDDPTTAPPPASGEVALTEVARVGSLTALAVDPVSGTAFLGERAGRVHTVDLTTGALGDVVLDLSAETTTDGERGLLGLAVDPAGEHLYVSSTDLEGATRIDEVSIDGASVDAAGRRTIFAIDQPFPNHNGGHVAFGPDGRLYLGLGDGGAAGDPLDAGQDPDNLLGKLLVLDPDGGAPEVFLLGVRNPWRFSWDRETDDLWLADVGQNLIEEVDLLPAADGGGAGANLGWNEMEGNEPFEGGSEPADHTAPVFTYTHDEGCSVTGGYVYRGERLPFLDGVYVFGDFCTSELWGLRVVDGAVTERIDLGLDLGDGELVSFGEDLDGELYVLTSGGTLYRLDPA